MIPWNIEGLWRPAAGLLTALAVVAVLGLLWHWNPQRVVEREFEQLVRQVENRNWKKTTKLLAENYRDPWHENRGEAVQQLAEVFRQFFWVEIEPVEPVWTRVGPEEFMLKTRFRIQGEGTGLAAMIVREANQWPGDFELRYVKQSRFPWDWKLQTVNHENPPVW